MSEGIDAVARIIATADTMAVAGHVGPDGDALGSMVALTRAARQAGKEAWATFGEPFVVPSRYRFLDTEVLVPVAEIPESLDVLVTVDCGDIDRLGSAGVLAERAGKVAVIDHHRSRRPFGDAAWVEPDAASTAQMVHRLLERLGWPRDRAIAEALYTGIVTDSGRFQYSSTDPELHRVAAALLEDGVAPDAIGQILFESVPFAYLGLAGRVLQRTALEPDLALAWSSLTKEDLATAGIPYEEADGLIDLIRIAEEAEVACLLRQVGDARTKGSLRSRGRVDVGAVAAALGGGGHHNAAGFTASAGIDETIEMVRRALR